MNISIIKEEIQSIWFRPDGTYNLNYWHSYNQQLAILSDEDLEEMKTKLNKVLSPVVDGDILLFKDSSFPKLFLKELNTKVTRTIKEEKATRVITDSTNIINEKDLNDITSCIVAKSDSTYYMFDSTNIEIQKINLEKFIADNNFTLLTNVKMIPISLTESKVKVLNDYNKLATTEDLIGYVNNFLPTPTEEQNATLLALLSSTEASNIELGINMVRMFNISDCVYDIFRALAGDDMYHAGRALDNVNRNNVRWKYLMSLGGFTMATFRNFNRSWSSELVLPSLYRLYNLPFISLEQKKKCWLHAYMLQGGYPRMNRYDSIMNQTESYKSTLSDQNLNQYGFPVRYDCIS